MESAWALSQCEFGLSKHEVPINRDVAHHIAAFLPCENEIHSAINIFGNKKTIKPFDIEPTAGPCVSLPL